MAKKKSKKQVLFLGKIILRDWLIGIVLSAVLFLGCYMLIMSHTYQLFGQLVTHVQTDQKVVALTFDDGPEPGHTEEILSILKKENIKATFYVIGVENVRHPSQLKEIVASGNDVGNHSYSHYPLIFEPTRFYINEVSKTDQQIRAAGYSGLITFRAPFSAKFIGLPFYLAQTGRISVSRDVAPDEVTPTLKSSQDMTAYVLAQTEPGSIILLHAMYDWSVTSRQSIAPIIDGLKAEGYRFVTISQLLNSGTPR